MAKRPKVLKAFREIPIKYSSVEELGRDTLKHISENASRLSDWDITESDLGKLVKSG